MGYYEDSGGNLQYDPILTGAVDISKYPPRLAAPEPDPTMPGTRSGAVTRGPGAGAGAGAGSGEGADSGDDPAARVDPLAEEQRRKFEERRHKLEEKERRRQEALEKDPEALKVASDVLNAFVQPVVPIVDRPRKGPISKNAKGICVTTETYKATLTVEATSRALQESKAKVKKFETEHKARAKALAAAKKAVEAAEKASAVLATQADTAETANLQVIGAMVGRCRIRTRFHCFQVSA